MGQAVFGQLIASSCVLNCVSDTDKVVACACLYNLVLLRA